MPKKRSSKAGLPPGTAMHVGDTNPESTEITIIDYTPKKLTEKKAGSAKECIRYKSGKSVTWINVDGLADVKLLEDLCKGFGLHPLVIEDILNTDQRPKIDGYDGYLFMVLRMLDKDGKNCRVTSEQISLVIGPGYILSFQESPGDIFDPVRKRMRNQKGHLRKSGSDYLAYTLIDSIVDRYFLILEELGDKIEDLEDELTVNASPRTLKHLYHMKREMIILRKSIWPLRDIVNNMLRPSFSPLIKKPTQVYLRDVYDHSIHVIDSIEIYRDMLTGMLDVYLSSSSNKLSEVMKILTVISTIFIPITFVTGLYGMNFQFMPELSHPLGYPAALALMLLMSLLMLFYFKRKGWI